MKKINKDGIRALIMETLEELSLGEGRKKKVEEQDDEAALHADRPADFNAAHAQTAANIATQTGQTTNVPVGDVAVILGDEDIKTFQDAVKAYNSDKPIEKAGAIGFLEPIADKIKNIAKTFKKERENKNNQT